MITQVLKALKLTIHRTLPLLTLGAIATSPPAFGHGGESRVAVELESSGPIKAGTSIVEFQLVDTKANTLITDQDLKVSHEKLLHVLFYDPALEEFRHVHPEYKNNVWQVELDPTVNGEYFFWAQGVLASDSTEFSSFIRLEVTNGNAAWPTPPKLSDIRFGSDRNSKATVENKKVRAGRMTMLNVTFTRDDGTNAIITPYLGAFAHIIAVADDGDTLIHVHPMNGNKPNEGMLHATFPRVGLYRLWIQFNDDGILKTVPMGIEVVP